MMTFLREHSWIAILVIGGSILVLQKNHRGELLQQTPERASTSQKLSQRSWSGYPIPTKTNAETLLERYRKQLSADPTSIDLNFSSELSALTARDITKLLGDPVFKHYDSATSLLRQHLRLLRRVLDPLAAVQHEPESTRLYALRNLAYQSPDQAADWVSQYGSKKEKISLEKELRRIRLLQDPATGKHDWQSYSHDETPIFPQEKFDTLASIIRSQEKPNSRQSTINSLLLSSAIVSPALAIRQANTLSLNPDEILPALENIGELGMGSHELIEWAIRIQHKHSPDLQDQLFRRYAWDDLHGAGNWLGKLEAPPGTRDIFLSHYAFLMAEIDPAQANRWAEKISSQSKRELVEKRIATTIRENR
ncbi:MAG: hypothetical protein P1U90_18360 [Akkermansiaceae bacterium]|nr:hypothetical protein [Akkermansiaceae bacterium]